MWRAPAAICARVVQHDVRGHGVEAALVHGRNRAMPAQVLAPARRLDVAGDPLLARDRQPRVLRQRRQRAAIRHQLRPASGRARLGRGGGPGRERLRQLDELGLAVGAEHAVRLAGQQRAVQRRVHPEHADVRGRIRAPHLRGDAAPEHQRGVHRHRDRHQPRRRQARAGGVVQRFDGQIEAGRLEAGPTQERDRRRHALRLMPRLVAGDENDLARSAHDLLPPVPGSTSPRARRNRAEAARPRRRSTSPPGRASASVPRARSGPTCTR